MVEVKKKALSKEYTSYKVRNIYGREQTVRHCWNGMVDTRGVIRRHATNS